MKRNCGPMFPCSQQILMNRFLYSLFSALYKVLTVGNIQSPSSSSMAWYGP